MRVVSSDRVGAARVSRRPEAAPLGETIPGRRLAARETAVLAQVAWKTFWIKSQRYRTICMACVAKQRDEERAGGVKQQEELSDDEPDGPQWGPVFLSPAARAILIGWHRRAAERLFGKLSLIHI